ncbi:hypothetical protein AD428_01380 [Achromobacter sp. DMS1]|nr:hypothetical protein AD428_01380 [Achromobacter sp. DMS1]
MHVGNGGSQAGILPQFLQHGRGLAHFLRPPLSVLCHAADQVSLIPLVPAHAGKAGRQGSQHATIHAEMQRRLHGLHTQGLGALDHDAAAELDGRRQPDLIGDSLGAHPHGIERWRQLASAPATQQHGHSHPLRRHRRHDGGFDIVRPRRLDMRAIVLLCLRRHRVQVDECLACFQMRGSVARHDAGLAGRDCGKYPLRAPQAVGQAPRHTGARSLGLVPYQDGSRRIVQLDVIDGNGTAAGAQRLRKDRADFSKTDDGHGRNVFLHESLQRNAVLKTSLP